MTFQVEGNQLRTPQGTIVSFDYRIAEFAEVDGVLIVVLDVPPNASMTENVFGVSKEGRILWQIERIPETGTDPTNCYTSIFPRLQLFNWSCVGVEIDVHKGTIINKWFGK